MKRFQLSPLPQYFDRYILKTDDVELMDAIQISIEELSNPELLHIFNALGTKVYAPGKWTVKDILQHLIDTERIFSYRALAFARNEIQPMPVFSEDDYAHYAGANNRTIADLVEELRGTHESLKKMFQSFTPAMLQRTGLGFKGPYSVASVGFMLPGHQRWHFNIIEERYLPLIG